MSTPHSRTLYTRSKDQSIYLSDSLLWNNIAHRIGRISRYGPICDPDIDERLHWSRILVRQQAVQLRNGAKVNKARVKIGPSLRVGTAANMPEWIDPVRVVQVGVDAEDLAEASADVVQECLGEACVLAEPVASC